MENAEQIQEYDRILRDATRLRSHPVGVNFLRDLALAQEVERAKGHRFCPAVMRARRGERLLLTAEEIACPAAASALGFKALPHKLESGEMLKGFGIFLVEAKAARTIRAMPRLELGKYPGIVLGPLDSFPNLPGCGSAGRSGREAYVGGVGLPEHHGRSVGFQHCRSAGHLRRFGGIALPARYDQSQLRMLWLPGGNGSGGGRGGDGILGPPFACHHGKSDPSDGEGHSSLSRESGFPDMAGRIAPLLKTTARIKRD